ncbi:MAG: phosphoribosylformylglycinamidine synthase subunit PurL [Deinococcales bacterium]
MSASLRDSAATFGLTEAEFDDVVERLGREPNTLEAGVFGALWSEHCGYKNSRPLLKRLPTTGPQVLQGPGENAGVVDIGDGWAVAFKMESHNHPSAVEPVQGAATGVGGILRDIFAMGARPVAVLDSLRFGELTEARNRYLLAGVVHGISLYGNAIGVPTVGGEIAFDPCYQENPLVNVMALGYLRHDELKRGTVGAVGNSLIYVGSKTGRDGLGGAVFASADLSTASDADRPAVQVGDPFMEKLLLEACLEAYARGLVAGVQDMGAAGLSSSVAEMAHRAGLGVDLDLAKVPRREEGMTALEVMLSESQERMLLTATPGRERELLQLLERWELDAHAIGVVRDHGRLRLFEGQRLLGDLPVAALNEPPSYTRVGAEAEETVALRKRSVEVPETSDPAGALLKLLESPTIASKEPVFRQYDHQVMTNTAVLPGRGDAAVLRVKGSHRGVAATVDCNARYVRAEPRLGAAHAVAEAARNLTCVGATPLGVTDNLNFGNPYLPEVYYQLEQAVEGLKEACLALGTPVTGGNVSLYNQYRSEDGYHAIDPTPTVGMVGVLPDVSRRADMALKRDGDVLLLVGDPAGTLGASEMLSRLHGVEAGAPPPLDLEREAAVQGVVRSLIQEGLCDTAHDVSEGGLAVALAEMAIAGGRGLDLSLPGAPGTRDDAVLFGEGAARIVLALRGAGELARAEALCAEATVPCHRLGTAAGEEVRMRTVRGAFAVPLTALRAAYHRPLADALR